jgi:hypothetical protein
LERPVKEKIPESSYKNVMCGSISHYNTIHDKGKKVPQRICSKYIARMPEDYYPTFKREFEKEIKFANTSPSVTKLVITDAHKLYVQLVKNLNQMVSLFRIFREKST